MNIDSFLGTGVAIITPFQSNGDIDFPALKKLIHYLTDGRVEYLVVLGTTGETATLGAEEKQKVFSYVAEVNQGRLPLVAGLGSNDTRSLVRLMQQTKLEGYQAILSVSPYYNKPNQEGIYLHYKALSEHSALPLMIYNVPGRTGTNLTAETTLRIAADFKNIIATKEASGNMEQIMQIIRYKPEGFELISGDDALTLPLIACGATGVISVVANAYPALFSDMVRYCLRGDFMAARPLHYMLTDIITSLFVEGSPNGIKTYLQAMGICEAHCRLPIAPVSDALAVRIRELMKVVAAS